MNKALSNKDILNDLIAYLKQLKREAVIDDKKFNILASVAVANYIESEMQSMVENVFDKGLSVLLR